MNPACVGRPFGIQWRIDGRRKTKQFETEADRLDFAKRLVGDVKAHGLASLRLDPDEARSWRAFRAELGPGVELDEVLRCWNRHGKAAQSLLTVEKAIEQFTAAKRSEGLAALTLAHYKPVMKRLAAAIGQIPIGRVTREDLVAWMEGLECAPVTRGREFAYARTFFVWLKNNRLIQDNPCDGIKRPKVVQEEVSVLTVDQAKKLFKSNAEDLELSARLALEAFAGLRFSSAAQVCIGDIDFKARGIVLPAAKIKTRRREYVDGFTDNLWKWLDRARATPWTMTPRQFLEAKSNAFIRAGIPHPRNVLRHSFATYDVAARKDVSGTAARLCHSSPKMLFKHYKGRGTEADGKAYFRIQP